MPELPEVETVRLGLEQAVLGKTIESVMQHRADLRVPFPENFAARITGHRIDDLTRRGKYILAHLDNHQVIILHLGMSGRVKIIPPNDTYNPEKHDHLVMVFDDNTYCIYNDARRFGMVMMTSNNELDSHQSFSGMGPEPLSDEFTPDILFGRFQNRKIPVKNALLDQRIVAGLGNIYVSEALFHSSIHPARPAKDVSEDETIILHGAIQDVLHKAIKAGGSSLRDYKHTDGEMGYFQHQFAVYDREGQPCPASDCACHQTGGIKKIVQSGRSTFFCPARQSK